MRPQGFDSRTNLLAGAMLALLTGLFFRDVLRGEVFFSTDFHQTFQPLAASLADAVRGGSWLWNPSTSNGMPLLANPMQAALYPPNLLALVLPAESALTWSTVLHVLFGASGAWLLARQLGLSPRGAGTAAVVFGFNGVAAAATALPNLCWAYQWLPWLLLGWERCRRRLPGSRLGPAGLVGLATACLLLLGEPFVLVAGASGLIALTLAGRAGPTGDGAGSSAPRLWGLAVGVAVASPFLLAVHAYLPYTSRGAGFPPEALTYWSMHPMLGFGLLMPGVFGDVQLDGLNRFWPRALSPEKGFPLFAGFYMGSLAVWLVALGLRRRWAARGPLVGWCCLLACMALGSYGPLYPLLSWTGWFDSLRFPMKWVLPAMLPLALLAGSGIEKLALRREGFGRLLGLLGVVAVLGVVSVAASPGLDGAMVSLVLLPDETGGVGMGTRLLVQGYVLRAVMLAVLPLLSAGLALQLLRRRDPRVAASIVVALLALDLLVSNPRLAPTVPPEFYRDTPPAVRALEREQATRGRVYVEIPAESDVRLAVAPRYFVDRARWQRSALVGYSGAAYHLQLAFNMDVGHFRSFVYAKLGSMINGAPVREKLMLLGAAGVTHLVTHSELDSRHLELLEEISGAAVRPQRIARNGLALDRVRHVPTALTYDDDADFMAAVQQGPDDLFRHATLIERLELERHGLAPQSRSAARAAPAAAGKVRVLRDTGVELRLATDGPAGYVVVADAWVPGWVAELDGRGVPVLRADYAFRAVRVPAGRHELSLRYRPWSAAAPSPSG